MLDRFEGVIELVGGPLDGQECAVSLPDDEKYELFFSAEAYPLPINVFPSQVRPGMVLLEYCLGRSDEEKAYYYYLGKKVEE